MEKRKAKLTISTRIDDGEEQSASYDAELWVDVMRAEMSYSDGVADVELSLSQGELTIKRKGDYDFFLRLKENERLPSSLGVGGSVGEIYTETREINYSITKNSLLLSVKYALCFDNGEKQKMKIRLLAKA